MVGLRSGPLHLVLLVAAGAASAGAQASNTTTEGGCPEDFWNLEVTEDCPAPSAHGRIAGWKVHGYWTQRCHGNDPTGPNASHVQLTYVRTGVHEECKTDADCGFIQCPTKCQCPMTQEGECRSPETICMPMSDECVKHADLWIEPGRLKECPAHDPTDACEAKHLSDFESKGCTAFKSDEEVPEEARLFAKPCFDMLAGYKQCMEAEVRPIDPAMFHLKAGDIPDMLEHIASFMPTPTPAPPTGNNSNTTVPSSTPTPTPPPAPPTGANDSNTTVWCPEDLWEVEVNEDCPAPNAWGRVAGWSVEGSWKHRCDDQDPTGPHASYVQLTYTRAGLHDECETDADCGSIQCPAKCQCDMTEEGKCKSTEKFCMPMSDECSKHVDLWIEPGRLKECPAHDPSKACGATHAPGFEITCMGFFAEEVPEEVRVLAKPCFDMLAGYKQCMEDEVRPIDPAIFHKTSRDITPMLERIASFMATPSPTPTPPHAPPGTTEWCPEDLWELEREPCGGEEGCHQRYSGHVRGWSFYGQDACKHGMGTDGTSSGTNSSGCMLEVRYHRSGLYAGCETDADCGDILCSAKCTPCTEDCGESAGRCSPMSTDCEKLEQVWAPEPGSFLAKCSVQLPGEDCDAKFGGVWETTGCNELLPKDGPVPPDVGKRIGKACYDIMVAADACLKETFAPHDKPYWRRRTIPKYIYDLVLPWIGPARKCINIPAFQAEAMKVLPCNA